jgi:tetratricopeptide (TPR) repeat protein
MPSRNKEAFWWIQNARDLWPPDINKILEYYKKAEEISPDYHIIFSDRARLFHGLERFPEAVANYDLEIKKQRERYKNTEMEKFETESEREEFERGQAVMEEMFGRMKQVRDEAAQKIETKVTYPWEDQIMYFFITDKRFAGIILDRQLSDMDGEKEREESFDEIAEERFDTGLFMGIFLGLINTIKNYLEKIGHPRDSYHDLAASNCALLQEMINDIRLEEKAENMLEGLKDDTEVMGFLKKTETEVMKKFKEWEKNKIGNFKFSFYESGIGDMLCSKMLEELTPIIQNVVEKKLLKTDHKN